MNKSLMKNTAYSILFSTQMLKINNAKSTPYKNIYRNICIFET